MMLKIRKLDVKMGENSLGDHIKFKKILSLFDYLKVLGDLDIFLLIISHSLRKIKNQEETLVLIRSVLDIMADFVKVKNTVLVDLTSV